MGAATAIEWCDHTFNPWLGCTRVSAACEFCYAEAWAKRSGLVQWGNHPRRRTTPATWGQPRKWNARAKADGVRRRVFCASLADWLDNQAPDAWRADLAELIDATPDLDWLLLTKRPQNFKRHAPWAFDQVPGNVWLGVTCENQDEFDRRWPVIAEIPAAVHFVSYEPALGPVTFRNRPGHYLPQWIIAGGESGPHARAPYPAWFRNLRDDCAAYGVPFLFKQWGEWFPRDQWEHNPDLVLPDDDVAYGASRPGLYRFDDVDGTHVMHRVGKKRAGRLLDGQIHNAFPSSPNRENETDGK